MFSLGLNSGAFWARPLRTASRRMIATAKTSPARQQEILIAQRKNRPVSPHLTIYQPQLTWYLSSLHRVSGVILAFGFFATTIAFGTSALLGLGLTSNNLARWYHEKVPRWMDLTAKGSFAYLFAFHFANGLRHLIWDAGKALTLRGVYTTGYAVMAVMALGGTYLLTW